MLLNKYSYSFLTYPWGINSIPLCHTIPVFLHNKVFKLFNSFWIRLNSSIVHFFFFFLVIYFFKIFFLIYYNNLKEKKKIKIFLK